MACWTGETYFRTNICCRAFYLKYIWVDVSSIHCYSRMVPSKSTFVHWNNGYFATNVKTFRASIQIVHIRVFLRIRLFELFGASVSEQWNILLFLNFCCSRSTFFMARKRKFRSLKCLLLFLYDNVFHILEIFVRKLLVRCLWSMNLF